MTPQRLFFVAITVALSMAISFASVEASQNAMARAYSAVIDRRDYTSRAIKMPGAARFHRRKSTAARRQSQEDLNKVAADFAAKNTEWQQAAMEQLKAGKTPQMYDEYHAGSHSGSSGQGSSESKPASTPTTEVTAASKNKEWTADSNTKRNDTTSSNDDDECDEEEESISPEEETKASPKQATKGTSAYKAEQDTGKQRSSKQSIEHSASQSHSSSSVSSAHSASSSASTSSSSTSSSLSSSGGGHTGEGTYYATGLGACGKTNSDSDRIAAISASLYDSFGAANPNENPACGHKIKATYQGKSTTITVVDRCVGCAMYDLDFSPTAFQDLADPSVGRLSGMTWEWVGSAP